MQPRLSSREPAAARRGERIYLDVAVRSGEGRKKYTLLAVDEATFDSFVESVSNLSPATSSDFLKRALTHFSRLGVETVVICDASTAFFCSPIVARELEKQKLVRQVIAPANPIYKSLTEKLSRTVVDDSDSTQRSSRADLRTQRK